MALGLALICTAPALAQLPPLTSPAVASGTSITSHYGIDFVTVGSPGNPAFQGSEHTSNPYYFGSNYDGGGSVPYQYQIARTELTVERWAQFATAFAPYWEGPANDVRFTGRGLVLDAPGHYSAAPHFANQAIIFQSWLVTAAYCNWLCNNQRSTADAFRTGAYDLRGINLANPAPLTSAITGNPGAAFRLPTLDEWNKATYFDPNRYGPGQSGWWLFPNSLDRPSISGYPGAGGETSAGTDLGTTAYSVGAYAAMQSPWGLLDTSGGQAEALTGDEDQLSGGQPYFRMVGTSFGSDGGTLGVLDQPNMEISGNRADRIGVFGIRIVSTLVPTPGVATTLIAPLVLMGRRKRNP